MNPVVSAQLKSFATENSESKGYKSDEFFEIYSIHSVLNGILTYNCDAFSAHLKGSEFGLDGIAIMVQNELCCDLDAATAALSNGKNHDIEFILFQSKTSEKLDYGDMSKFFDATVDFFNSDFAQPSTQITDLMEAKDAIYDSSLKKNPGIRLYYVTTGTNEISEQVEKLINATKTRLEGLSIFSNIHVSTIGAKDLQEGYRNATNSFSATLEILKPATLPEHPSVQQAFLGYVSAQELLKIVTINDDNGDGEIRVNRSVFFDNIRDYNEKSKINTSIIEELKKGNQNSFIFKNNGVTVVARDINRKGDKFEIEDYQVVNGCQTCNILIDAREHISDVFVPFRLIGSSDKDFTSTIIIGTNKQNEVKEDQFWALSPFMKDLEEYCQAQKDDAKLFIERRESQYRKSGIERTRIIKPGDLIKAMAGMFFFQPNRAARDYRGIKNEYSDKIFQSTHSVMPYHLAALGHYKFDYLVRNKKIDRAWNIYKYYVLSKIGRNATGGKDIFQLRKKDGDKICVDILKNLTDEDLFLNTVNGVGHYFDRRIVTEKLDTREKIRDWIRSDAVAKSFVTDLKP